MANWENTWIKVYRGLLNSQVWENTDLLKVWLYCLLRANYSERWESIQTGSGFTEVHLMPGQFVFGRKKAAKDLKMKPSSVRNRMQKLKNMRNLDIQPEIHFSIITICNWELYQGGVNNLGQARGQPQDNQGTTTGQPGDTDNKDKKEEKDDNKTLFPNNNFAEQVKDRWNEHRDGLPSIRSIDGTFKTRVAGRFKSMKLSRERFLNMIEFLAKTLSQDKFLVETQRLSLRTILSTDSYLNTMIEKAEAKLESEQNKETVVIE